MEEIVNKLRRADVLILQGQTVTQVCKRIVESDDATAIQVRRARRAGDGHEARILSRQGQADELLHRTGMERSD